MKLHAILSSGKTGTVEADNAVFGATPNMALVSQAVAVYLSNQRQGTSKVKTRSEINRTKKKWFKQKHTGNARHGARTPNIFVGGGVSHGPNGLQNWTKLLSKGQRRKSLMYGLSLQAKNTIVFDGLETLKGKTKEAAAMLRPVTQDASRVLVILAETIDTTIRALRNIDGVVVSRVDRLNIYEVVGAQKIVLSSKALKALEKWLTQEPAVKAEKIAKVPRKNVTGKVGRIKKAVKITAKTKTPVTVKKSSAKPSAKSVVKAPVKKEVKVVAPKIVKKIVVKKTAKKPAVKAKGK